MTAATLTLTDFLLARIAEDEAVAHQVDADLTREFGHASSELSSDLQAAGSGPMHYPTLTIDPTRVLAECAAKRLILTMHEEYMSSVRAYRSPRWQEVEDAANRSDRLKAEARGRVSSDIVQALAQVYADHPEFRDEWRWANR